MRPSPLLASGVFALLAATSPALAFEPIVVMNGEGTALFHGREQILATAAQSDGEFGISITTDATPGQGAGMIVHTKEAELWFVLEGEYTFIVDGTSYDAGPGTLMVADAGTPHQAISKGPGRILQMWMPGGFEQFFVDWDEQILELDALELGALEESYGITRPH